MREVARSIDRRVTGRELGMTVQVLPSVRRLGNRENEGRKKTDDSEINGKIRVRVRSRVELYHHLHESPLELDIDSSGGHISKINSKAAKLFSLPFLPPLSLPPSLPLSFPPPSLLS